MHALKGISESFSRLLSDSPPHVEDHHPDPQVMSYPKEGNSFSSIVSFILPSLIFGNSKKNECIDENLPSIDDEPFHKNSEYDNETEQKEVHEIKLSKILVQSLTKQYGHVGNGDPDSAKSNVSGSTEYEDALESPGFPRPMPNLTEDSLFISPELYDFFEASLPDIVKGFQWVLLYSMAKHGMSLRTLIRKSGELSGPCLLITGDKKGAIFGGLLDCPLEATGKRRYQGTNQSFVFTTLYGAPVIFRSTGANRYFYFCMNDLLAIGGGTNFALCMDGDLLTGTSGPSETFGNVCLAHDQEFELKNVELWGFKHASKYTT